MANFRKALLINFASTTGATAVQFFVSILLARLLTPSEIGVYSITIVLVNIAHVFRDFGVASYLQRENDLTDEKIRSAMGVLYSSSWLIALTIFLASGYVAEYFSHPEIEPVMQVLSIGFLFIPFSSVMLSLLTREFEAVKLAWVTLAGTAAYTVTCLGLAYLGFGTMSLAWANLANIVACGVAFVALRPVGLPWLPSFRNWGRAAKFGAGALLTNALNAINSALPDLLLGKLGTAHQVGLVSRANSTVNIFLTVAGSAINFGSLSYLAQIHHRGEPLEPMLNRAAALVTGVGWPALAFTAFFGHEVVAVLYGSAWLGSVPAIAPLALAAAVTMLFHYSGTAFAAVGRPYLAAAPIAISALTRIAFGVSLFTGSISSFAWALVAATLITAPTWFYLQAKYLQCRPMQTLAAIWPSAVITGATILVCEIIRRATADADISPVQKILLTMPILFVLWYGLVHVLKHPLNAELKIFREAISRRLRNRLFS